MKPTEQLREIAKAYVKPFRHNLHLGEEEGFVNDLVAFAEHLQAISQMQQEWVRANPMTVETAAKLADTDLNLILCRFDNGQILRYNEDHPFAVLTDLLFIPQPPKDINQ